MHKDFLEVGKVVSTHGVAGEVKLQLWCDDTDAFADCTALYLDATGEKPRKLLQVRPHKGMALVTLEGVADMDAARAMVGRVLYAKREELHLPTGHYFIQDLQGLEARDATDGHVYGQVEDVIHPGAQDIYLIRTPQGGTAMVPSVAEFVREVAPEKGYILLSPIPGMFEEAESGDAT